MTHTHIITYQYPLSMRAEAIAEPRPVLIGSPPRPPPSPPWALDCRELVLEERAKNIWKYPRILAGDESRFLSDYWRGSSDVDYGSGARLLATVFHPMRAECGAPTCGNTLDEVARDDRGAYHTR